NCDLALIGIENNNNINNITFESSSLTILV
ncbi:unnamed protein product, partial [Rotaria sp. Silwood1]